MSDEFYNPFHFVPVAKPAMELKPRGDLAKRPPARPTHQHVTHDRYVTRSNQSSKQEQPVYSGRIVCRLKTITPTVIGAHRKEAKDNRPAEVFPFEVPALRNGKLVMEPAIPESSLRGMISSLYEALTNSSLRVLNDTAMSVRMNAIVEHGRPSEALQAVGMIHIQNGKRYLLPLTYPSLRDGVVPPMFQEFEAFAQMRIYVDRCDDLLSHSPDTVGVYFLKATLPALMNHAFSAGSEIKNRGGFVGWGTAEKPIALDEWRKQPPGEQQKYIPGLLRNIRGQSAVEFKSLRPSEANGPRDLPKNVKHAWFIPLHPTVFDPAAMKFVYESKRLPLIDAEEAARTFEAMARERTLAEIELPYELRGSLRNNGKKSSKKNDSHVIGLRTGDLVCFSLNGQVVSELAISSIWRRPAGSVHDWFQKIGEDAVPLNPTRVNLTLAEQVFGVVEQDFTKNKDKRPKALAGRVRFSTARLCSQTGSEGPYLAPATMQILSSPKPPCPLFYFRRTNGKPARKKDLPRTVATEFQPQGRKAYLIHDESLLSWVSRNDEEKLRKQKAKVGPLRPEIEFLFDITFDNLSATELGLLLFSLKPTSGFRHRLGMGKPFGLGTVEVRPAGLFLIDRHARYQDAETSRYQEVSWFDVDSRNLLEMTHVDSSVRSRYRHEIAAVSQEITNQWAVLTKHARTLLETTYPNSLAVVESLGNPATTAGTPVHYPRLPDAWLGGSDDANREKELFKWHVWNEKRENHNQFLSPLSKGKATPNKLLKTTPFRFFLYSHLPHEECQNLLTELAVRFPGQFFPTTPEEMKPHPSDYQKEIAHARDQGEIPIHLGTEFDKDAEGKFVLGSGPISCYRKNGDPERESVHDRWRHLYLPTQPQNDTPQRRQNRR